MNLNETYVAICSGLCGDHNRTIFRAGELYEHAKNKGVQPDNFMNFVKDHKVSRGVYDLSRIIKEAPAGAQMTQKKDDVPLDFKQNSFVPEVDSDYVETEFFHDIFKLLIS